MSPASVILNSLARHRRYTLMRGCARFKSVRSLVAKMRGAIHRNRTKRWLEACESRMGESLFKDVDLSAFVDELRTNGVAFGLQLPRHVVNEVHAWSMHQLCYADREPHLGFQMADRGKAEQKLGKPILLGQYFNVATDCPTIANLASDPALLWIAASFLDSSPNFVGANLWWTFPVQASEADRSKHAHVFHRDLDDFRFFKFFFYLTDVPSGEGAHICVVASHTNPPRLRAGDPWNFRRYDDQEVTSTFKSSDIVEICGQSSSGFAENTLCIHKGSTPKKEARLLLQLQFAMFDYGVMHDRRQAHSLDRLV
jgi:hypothetical protein